MSPNRRIFLNVLASYGRSILAIACGLFSTRWVLMALGQTDMGLYGLIGGLTLFVSFFNIQFSIAISRYFAHSIGLANKDGNDHRAVEECRHWFNVAVFIHILLPMILVCVGIVNVVQVLSSFSFIKMGEEIVSRIPSISSKVVSFIT